MSGRSVPSLARSQQSQASAAGAEAPPEQLPADPAKDGQASAGLSQETKLPLTASDMLLNRKKRY